MTTDELNRKLYRIGVSRAEQAAAIGTSCTTIRRWLDDPSKVPTTSLKLIEVLSK